MNFLILFLIFKQKRPKIIKFTSFLIFCIFWKNQKNQIFSELLSFFIRKTLKNKKKYFFPYLIHFTYLLKNTKGSKESGSTRDKVQRPRRPKGRNKRDIKQIHIQCLSMCKGHKIKKKRSGTLSKSISNAFRKFTFKIERKSSDNFWTFRSFKFKIQRKSSEKVQIFSELLGLLNLKYKEKVQTKFRIFLNL